MGLNATARPVDDQPSLLVAQRSLPPSAYSSPGSSSLNAFGLDAPIHRSRKDASISYGASTSRGNLRRFTVSNMASPTPNASTAFRSPSLHAHTVTAKRTRALPSFCALLKMLVEQTSVSDELFEQIAVFVCLCFGQDGFDTMLEYEVETAYQLLTTTLGSKGGRRGESMIRNILEGKTAKTCRWKASEIDRWMTKGAVM